MEKRLMDFDIISEKSIVKEFSGDIIIYFVLEGGIRIESEQETKELAENEFYLLNPYTGFRSILLPGSLLFEMKINPDLIQRFTDTSECRFFCDSRNLSEEERQEFLKLFNECIRFYYGKKMNDTASLIHLESVYYQLLEKLVCNYMITDSSFADTDENGDQVRINSIIRYVNEHFKETITLSDLSERLYLSTSYISRYIKNKLGKNLMEYLTEIRLAHAVDDLKDTEESVVHVALNNGFANVTSFNKSIKAVYNMTPKQYREQYAQGQKQGTRTQQDSLSTRVVEYLENYSHNMQPRSAAAGNVINITCNTEEVMHISRSWGRMLNAGRAVTLLRSDIQEHILRIKKWLDPEYIRFWDIFDEEMFMNARDKNGHYNFSKLDKIIDFLVENGMRPYIELGLKPVIITAEYDTFTKYSDRPNPFDSLEEYGRFLRSFIAHMINKHGVKEVSQWYFEQWCDPKLFSSCDNPEQFLDVFETSYTAIKSMLPEAKVVGNFDRPYHGRVNIHSLFEHWSKRGIQPDRISVYVYQNQEKFEGFNEAADGEFLQKYIRRIKSILSEFGMNIPLQITEWNYTIVNKNVLNDSTFKGAFVLNSLMRLYPEVDLMGYWFASDLYVDWEEEPGALNGYCGLLSYYGSRKPAFYALEFMNRLYEYLMIQTDNLMATTNGYGDYMITVHNFQNVNFRYDLRKERDITIERIPSLFDSAQSLRLNMTITNVTNGTYGVKTRRVNRRSGSVQDEWISMGMPDHMNDKDMEYLENISVPKINIIEESVRDNKLQLGFLLDANEILNIHIYRIYKDI